MLIKILQWNIGGGGVRQAGSDVHNDFSYKRNGLAVIKKVLSKYQPDIIFLQEVHRDRTCSQTKELANFLNTPYYLEHKYTISHLDDNQDLCLAIISRFSIRQSRFKLFKNPKIIFVFHGKKVTAHNKGVLSCFVSIKNKSLCLESLHLFPFRRWSLDPMSRLAGEIKRDILQKIKTRAKNFILAGDYNYNDARVKNYLPCLFKEKVKEIVLSQPTTPKGRCYDHVVYRGLRLKKCKVINSVLTDHFPVYCEFEI